jgi:hypothetical protein
VSLGLHGPRCDVQCALCQSDNHAEFAAELNLQFLGLRNLGTPSVLLFPKVSVCLDCGFSNFTTPEAELQKLKAGSTRSGGQPTDPSRTSISQLSWETVTSPAARVQQPPGSKPRILPRPRLPLGAKKTKQAERPRWTASWFDTTPTDGVLTNAVSKNLTSQCTNPVSKNLTPLALIGSPPPSGHHPNSMRLSTR